LGQHRHGTPENQQSRINEGEAIAALQVLERHPLDQRRLAGTGLPNNVHVQKAIFVFDAEQAFVVAEIDPGKVNCMTCIHITHA
jgi:hypothetical protein